MKSTFLLLAILIIPFLASANSSASEQEVAPTVCLSKGEGQVRWYERNKLKTVRRDYCYQAYRHEIESLNCQQNDSNCLARQYKAVDSTALFSQIGSPGFRLCSDHYAAVPKIIDFQAGTQWVTVSICEFSDGSFIDLGRLEARSR